MRQSSSRSFIVFAAMVLAMTLQPVQAKEFTQSNHIVLASLNTAKPSIQPETGLFGYGEQRYADISAFTKWTGALKNFKKEFRASVKQQPVQDWMKMLGSAMNKSRQEQIEAVNQYMNKVAFVSDQENYGTSDKWATPMEFLARGGDCEDYAFAKYISLRALGFERDQLRLAIVYDYVMRMPHAILIVYDQGSAYVLDNQNPDVVDASDISRYKPIYSISQLAWWRH